MTFPKSVDCGVRGKEMALYNSSLSLSRRSQLTNTIRDGIRIGGGCDRGGSHFVSGCEEVLAFDYYALNAIIPMMGRWVVNF